jgi:hypothetical protein
VCIPIFVVCMLIYEAFIRTHDLSSCYTMGEPLVLIMSECLLSLLLLFESDENLAQQASRSRDTLCAHN